MALTQRPLNEAWVASQPITIDSLPVEHIAAFLETCTSLQYVRSADILFLCPGTLQPGYTLELGECFAYRVSYDRQHLVAIEVHNFRAVVLKRNPQLARAWKEYTNPLRRWLKMRSRAKRFILLWLTGQATPRGQGGSGQWAHA